MCESALTNREFWLIILRSFTFSQIEALANEAEFLEKVVSW